MVNCLASSSRAVGVNEIAGHTGLTKSNVSRTLATLQRADWVRQDPDNGKFVLGPRVLEVGLSRLAHLDVRRLSSPLLNDLRERTGETALLAMRLGLEQLPIDQVESDHESRTVLRIGRTQPLWSSASGKAILAYLKDAEIEAVLDGVARSGVRVLASGQMLDLAQLRESLVEIRERGFAVSAGERLVGVTAVAAPVFDRESKPAAALSVIGPLPRYTLERAEEHGPDVLAAARLVSAELGQHYGD